MGGEWWFSFVRPEQFDIIKYQTALLKIRNEFKKQFDEDFKSEYIPGFTAFWSPTDGSVPPENNIFVKFTYKCDKHSWHRNEHGERSPNNTAYWLLYWNPLTAPTDYFSDVHARCSPYLFTGSSVMLQKRLATEFSEHFQLYLGDDINGYGPARQQYWGVGFD